MDLKVSAWKVGYGPYHSCEIVVLIQHVLQELHQQGGVHFCE